MSRDYKPRGNGGGRRGGAGMLILGVFIGLLLGLAIAAGIAWYVNKMPSPFVTKETPPARPEPARKPELPKPAEGSQPGKARFDFYDILSGTEERVAVSEMKPRAERPAAKETPKEPPKEKESSRESYYLQAGAFQSASDADALKGRLALIGVEATVQPAEIPDKGLWHRVRLGPYHHPDEVERVRGVLRQNGMDAALIKVREPG